MEQITLTEAELKANAEEYLVFRQKRLGASEIPAVLGLSPYTTAYQLWKIKTGRVKSEFFTNPAIEIGKQFEDTARARYEMRVDADFPPKIFVSETHPFMHASLDGFNEDSKVVLEIKCVSGDKVFVDALDGKVASHYRDQVQQQMYCSGAAEAHFYVCKVENVMGTSRIVGDALVIEKADPERQKFIVEKALEFWNCVLTDTPPPLTDRDAIEVDDVEATTLLNDKEKLVKYLVEKYNHTNYHIGKNKLRKDKNGVWKLTLKKD